MKRMFLFTVLLATSGCDLVENTQDALDGLTNPLVGLGLVIGVEEPEEVDLASTGLESGTTFSMFLADAASADDLENAPIDGATVTLEGIETDPAVDGLYVLGPDRAPSYVGQAIFDVAIDINGEMASGRVRLPDGPDFVAIQGHTPGEGLTIDLTGQGFNAAIVVVIESSSGELTFSNEPETAREVYDLTRGNGDVGAVDVPGTAFPSDNEVYVMGIAGLHHTETSNLDGMNTVISSLSAGQMVFQPVSTFDEL